MMSKAGSFSDDSSRLGQATVWIAHKLWLLLPVAITVRILTYFYYEESWSKVVEGVFTWSLIIVFAFSTFHSVSSQVCSKCFDEVPNNASEMAERRLPFLWVQHQQGKGIWLVLVGVLLVQTLGLSTGITWVKIASSIPGDIFLFGIIYSFWTHHRLSLFCPWCKGWEDGERVPDPDPVNKNYVK